MLFLEEVQVGTARTNFGDVNMEMQIKVQNKHNHYNNIKKHGVVVMAKPC